MTTTAIYRDPATYELLFMERRDDDGRWIPCLDAMEAWRTATWRLYQIVDTDEFVTMPGHQRWSLLSAAEEANIDHVLVRPWIPDGSAMDVTEGELSTLDLLLQMSVSGDDHEGPPPAATTAATTAALYVHHTHHHVWDLMRPMLVWEDPFLQRAHAPPPAAAVALRLLAAAAEEDQTVVPKTAPLPKHIADLVLRDAEATGATCPISMEPIKAAEASVTSCGHVFQTEAIRHWLGTGHGTCPECRQPCSV